jgi:hypothetical protein
MTPAGFETAIPVSEWSQNDVMDRAATGIGYDNYYHLLLHLCVVRAINALCECPVVPD